MTWLEPVDPPEGDPIKPAVMKINGTWAAICFGHEDGYWSYSADSWPDQWTAALVQAVRHFVAHHMPARWNARGRPGESAP